MHHIWFMMLYFSWGKYALQIRRIHHLLIRQLRNWSMVGSTSEHVSPLKDPGITAAQRPRGDRKRKQNIDKNVGTCSSVINVELFCFLCIQFLHLNNTIVITRSLLAHGPTWSLSFDFWLKVETWKRSVFSTASVNINQILNKYLLADLLFKFLPKASAGVEVSVLTGKTVY